MLKKIKNFMIVAASVFTLSAPMLVPVAAHAAIDKNNNALQNGLCEGLNDASNTDSGSADVCDGQGESALQGIVRTIINIFSLIVGFVSVIMIILGGFKYITSGGEASNVTGAKNTILYAVVGLVIVALAQVIVRFVLTKATA